MMVIDFDVWLLSISGVELGTVKAANVSEMLQVPLSF